MNIKFTEVFIVKYIGWLAPYALAKFPSVCSRDNLPGTKYEHLKFRMGSR